MGARAGATVAARSSRAGWNRPTSTSSTPLAASAPYERSLHRRRMRAGRRDPLVIVYGHHMSDGTMFAPLARYSSRGFAEGHRSILVFTREKEIELEVFAMDVVNASSEGKQADRLRRRGGARRLPRRQIVPVRGRPGRAATPAAQAWAFVTCSYQTSNSRTVVYAKEVEAWDSRPSE